MAVYRLFLTVVMITWLVLLQDTVESHNIVKRQLINRECDYADIVLILDESGSVGQNDWDSMIDFIKGVIDQFDVGPDKNRFGAVTFSSSSTHEFNLDDHTTANAVKTALENINYSGGSTNIAAGFRRALQVFQDDGNRPDVIDIAVLVTDGQANVEVGNTVSDANALKSYGSGVNLLTLGISSNVDEAQLILLATYPSWYYNAASYSELDDIFSVLLNATCEAANNGTGPVNRCKFCNDFDNNGYGYMPHEESCYLYYLCEQEGGEAVQVRGAQPCPYGTVFNPNEAILGRPCGYPTEEYPDCPRPAPEGPVVDTSCDFVANPENAGEFGFQDEGFVPYGSCDGGTFDEETCTCLGQADCTCRLLVDFTGDVQDHSCHRGHVINRKPRVKLVSEGFGTAGFFKGVQPGKKNQPHLYTKSLDGALGQCEHGGQDKLTVATWVWYYPEMGKKGLVTYCDGNLGPTFYLALIDGVAWGGIRTYGNPLVEVNSVGVVTPNAWNYISMVYDGSMIYLYVTPLADFASCGTAAAQPSCSYVDAQPQTGCVESRDCGLQIGASGKRLKDGEFLHGYMDNVQVYFGSHYLACLAP